MKSQILQNSHPRTRAVSRPKVAQLLSLLLLSAIVYLLTSCTGGGTPPSKETATGSGTGTGGGTTNLTLSSISFGTNPLSANGTTSVEVNVLNNGTAYQTPYTVTFSSPCATAGKAELTDQVTTINGKASTSYLDKGCAGDDVITASIATNVSVSSTLKVDAPTSGSIQFVSVSPSTIALKGSGGTGRQETSRVTFKVLDSVGNPIGGKTVNFALSTTIGGLALITTSSTSAADTGLVVTDVQAGTVGTPVRVTASTLSGSGATLSTMSDLLVVQTGLPDQDSFSLSFEKLNIEGWNWDGTTTAITARLADHFNNPVPNGTAVYFTSEGGSITPSCVTTGGECTVTLSSQNPRPADGRVTVLAYAIGEESFTDLDGDGLADLVPNEIVQDMPEAWVDWNMSGVHEATEPFIDFNGDTIYNPADEKYNGGFCSESPDPNNPNRFSYPGTCSSQKTIHVRMSGEIVFSGSTASTQLSKNKLSHCANIDPITLTVFDNNGNVMPSGTTIDVTSAGDIVAVGTEGGSKKSFTVGNTTQQGSGVTTFPIQINSILPTEGEGEICTLATTGSLEVTVTTPKGNTNKSTFALSIDPNTGGSSLPGVASLTLSPLTFTVNPLTAYGSTSVQVTVSNNSDPYTTPTSVSFSSLCASIGKAEITPTVFTSATGVASATYRDNGCANNDIITATLSNGQKREGTLAVSSPLFGSIQFVSATPTTLALKGTGGGGRLESARVIFKVVDSLGNPIGGKLVNFALNTEIGGLHLVASSATSDPATGKVIADVQAGIIGTPVKVIATTTADNGLLQSNQSNQLVVTTGYPDQNSFSLSVETFNIEALNYDGSKTTFHVRLADHFNNPVPEGTAVYFTSEGGSITPSCTTDANGYCFVSLTSQNPRPTDGRVTILAYAIGEESFTDLDGDGLADAPSEIVGDMPEAWVDWNMNGVREATEPFVDFNSNSEYNGPDGKFNGTLCNETPDPDNSSRYSTAGTCSTSKTIHVRESAEIVFSGSTAGTIELDSPYLSSCTAVETIYLTLKDTNGNPMPSGTKIEVFSSPLGNIVTTGTLPSTVGNSALSGMGITKFPVQITGFGTCTSTSTGSLMITVTTPKGSVTNEVFSLSINRPGSDTLTLSPITLGANPLAAYGTTTVKTTVLENSAPYADPITVTFSSVCAAAGYGTLTPNVTTVNGIATANYQDDGCANIDTIIASISNGQTATKALTVQAPVLGILNLIASKLTLQTNSTDEINFTVIAKDASNAPMASKNIRIASTGGLLSTGSVTTGADGKATFSISVADEIENKEIILTVSADDALDKTQTITVTGTTLTLIKSKSSTTQADATPIELTATLRDAASKPISGATINFNSSNGNTFQPAATRTTDNSGVVKVNYNASTVGIDTVTVTGKGASETTSITVDAVSLASFDFISPPDQSIVSVDSTENLTVEYLSTSGDGKDNETLYFYTNKGYFGSAGITQTSKKTDSQGHATITFSTGDTAGPVQIFVENSDSSKQAQLTLQIRATVAATIDVQVSPSVLPISIGGNISTSTIKATVRDAKNQAVAGKTVSFSILNGPGGSEFINPVTAVTDDSGIATTTFTSGNSPSALDGVLVQASILQSATTLTDTASLTIALNAATIDIGATNKIEKIGSTGYKLPFTVVVTDSNGAAVNGAEVTLSLMPIRFYTGYSGLVNGIAGQVMTGAYLSEDSNRNYILDLGEDKGDGVLQPEEDTNNNGILDPCEDKGNGILDPGEDTNNNGILDLSEDGAQALYMNSLDPIPDTYWVNGSDGQPAIISGTKKGNCRLDPGAVATVDSKVITGDDGMGTFYLYYPKNSGNWVDVEITAATDVTGTNSSAKIEVPLSVEENDKPYPDSPFGTRAAASGLPDQSSFSLSASIINPEGWNYDGETSTITVRASDRLHNPVPDGTPVYFTAEGGSIEAQCLTIGGTCSVIWTSSDLRPATSATDRAGLSTITAYAVGEESFNDINGNGEYDTIDKANWLANPGFDLPEAFRDDNLNGQYDVGETYFNYVADGQYTPGDGLYNGSLCSTAGELAGVCTRNLVHIRKSLVLAMSGSSNLPIQFFDTDKVTPILSVCLRDEGFAPIDDATGCANAPGEDAGAGCDDVKKFWVTVADLNGNSPPNGTTIKATSSLGEMLGTSTYTVTNTLGPFSGFFSIQEVCGGTPEAEIEIKVTTPNGVETIASITVYDDN